MIRFFTRTAAYLNDSLLGDLIGVICLFVIVYFIFCVGGLL